MVKNIVILMLAISLIGCLILRIIQDDNIFMPSMDTVIDNYDPRCDFLLLGKGGRTT